MQILVLPADSRRARTKRVAQISILRPQTNTAGRAIRGRSAAHRRRTAEMVTAGESASV